MPTYTFHCEYCGHSTDVFGRMMDGAPKGVKCGHCDSDKTYRVWKNVRVIPDWEPQVASTLQDFDAPDPRKSSPVVKSRRDMKRILDLQEKHTGVKLERVS